VVVSGGRCRAGCGWVGCVPRGIALAKRWIACRQSTSREYEAYERASSTPSVFLRTQIHVIGSRCCGSGLRVRATAIVWWRCSLQASRLGNSAGGTATVRLLVLSMRQRYPPEAVGRSWNRVIILPVDGAAGIRAGACLAGVVGTRVTLSTVAVRVGCLTEGDDVARWSSSLKLSANSHVLAGCPPDGGSPQRHSGRSPSPARTHYRCMNDWSILGIV
jgi:hypothetical protein